MWAHVGMTPERLMCLLARLCLPVILGNHHPVTVSVGRVYEPHGFVWRVRRISATALETWKLLVASLHVDRTVEGDPTWGMSVGFRTFPPKWKKHSS